MGHDAAIERKLDVCEERRKSRRVGSGDGGRDDRTFAIDGAQRRDEVQSWKKTLFGIGVDENGREVGGILGYCRKIGKEGFRQSFVSGERHELNTLKIGGIKSLHRVAV